jgi:hypothetical protein
LGSNIDKQIKTDKKMKVKYSGYSFELSDKLNESYAGCMDDTGVTDTNSVRGSRPQRVPVPANREFSMPKLSFDEIRVALSLITI